MNQKQLYLIIFFYLSNFIIFGKPLPQICKIKNPLEIIFNNSYNQIHCLNTKTKQISQFCLKCIEKGEKKQKNCKKCSASEILNVYKVFSPEDTLDEIINHNKSIVRFGDGEFEIIFGKDIGFQKNNKKLSKRLYQILNSNEEGLLIGIYNGINSEELRKYNQGAYKFYIAFNEKNKFKLAKVLNRSKQYYSTQITRFYIDYKNKLGIGDYVKKLKKLWDKREVVIIEGEKSRLGIGNDLFNNVKSLQRILCPNKNAFKLYNKIYNEARKIEKIN